jgi:cytochrome c oxidase subunit 2
MPTSASTVSDDTDMIFYFIHYLSAFFFAGIVAATIYFALKYKKRGENDKTSPIEHNSKLEFWWSVLPGLLLVVMFVLLDMSDIRA